MGRYHWLFHAIVEIFESRSPVRRDRKLYARTKCKALAQSQNLLFVTGQIGVVQEAGPGPRKSPGRVEKPVVKGITHAAAECRNEVELFGDGAGRD